MTHRLTKHVFSSAFLLIAMELLEANEVNIPDSISVDTMEIKSMVVTATRSHRKLSEVPRAVNVVDQQLMQERLTRTSAEALREETGIEVQKTEHAGGNAIIRGMGSSKILLLVDGIRLNNATYREGNHPYLTTVDFNTLERMEVVRGPGSTLYGGDAMGGTVNLITKKLALGHAHFIATGRASARYATADHDQALRVESGIAGQKFAMVAGAGIKAAGNLRRGENALPWGQGPRRSPTATQANTAYNAQDLDGKLTVEPSSNHRLSLNWQSSKRPEIPRYDRYEEGYYRWHYTNQNREFTSLIYDKSGESVAYPIHAFLSYHRQEEGRRIQKTVTSNTTEEWAETGSYGVGIQSGTSFGPHSLILGADTYLDQVASNRFSTNTTTGVKTQALLGLYPDGSSYLSFGTYVQDELRMGRWSIVAGGRFSFVRMEYIIPVDTNLGLQFGDFTNDFPAITGSLGLNYELQKSIHLVGSVAQGFRTPNLSDVARNGESRGINGGRTAYEIPNSEIEPEEILGFEAGVKVDLSRFKSNVVCFYNEVTKLLDTRTAVLRGDSNFVQNGNTYLLQSKQNTGEAYITGFEMDLRARLYSNLWVNTNATYTFGMNTTANKPTSQIPPVIGLVGIKWSKEHSGIEVYSRFAGDQKRLSASDHLDARIPQVGGTALNPIRASLGWATLNVRGEWRGFRHLKLRGAIENIFDTNYREHGSGINAPGVNFIFGIESEF